MKPNDVSEENCKNMENSMTTTEEKTIDDVEKKIPSYDELDLDDLLSRSRPLTTRRRRCFYEAPEFIQRLSAYEEKNAGDSIVLESKVKGFPSPSVKWFKDEDQLSDEDERYLIQRDMGLLLLTIENLAKADEGTYKCKAENCEGSTSTFSYVSVKGETKPKRPKRKSSHSPVRSPIAFPPNIATIVEDAIKEEREEEEYSHLPPSPIDYDKIRKARSWPRTVKKQRTLSDPEDYTKENDGSISPDFSSDDRYDDDDSAADDDDDDVFQMINDKTEELITSIPEKQDLENTEKNQERPTFLLHDESNEQTIDTVNDDDKDNKNRGNGIIKYLENVSDSKSPILGRRKKLAETEEEKGTAETPEKAKSFPPFVASKVVSTPELLSFSSEIDKSESSLLRQTISEPSNMDNIDKSGYVDIHIKVERPKSDLIEEFNLKQIEKEMKEKELLEKEMAEKQTAEDTSIMEDPIICRDRTQPCLTMPAEQLPGISSNSPKCSLYSCFESLGEDEIKIMQFYASLVASSTFLASATEFSPTWFIIIVGLATFIFSAVRSFYSKQPS
ncbi:unnamed protein product [Owenia fusiformis]|uniref:Uncharacterized protein n=1 Tax=Owenia fusiformis TaxID=6347 RepID=A0A8J1UC74_OWEFU|nr:unnamed protein product [Owenia fusiformis]